MFKLFESFLLLCFIICCKLSVNVCAISRNSSIATQRSDGFFGSSSSVDRQFPADPSYLIPQMVIGILIPIAIIIGIGVILMKLFIIGFWFLGRGGYGIGQGVGNYGGGYYPWRVDQPQQQTARSLLGKDGSLVPPYLSSTLWNLIEKVSNSLENFEKNKV